MTDGCSVVPDEQDGQTLLVEYPTLYPGGGDVYVSPRVKIEAGARSALDPSTACAVTPYVAGELSDWRFSVANVATPRAGTDLLGEAADPAWPALRIPRRRPAARRQGPDLAPLLRRRDDCVVRDWRGRPVRYRFPCSTPSARTISSPSGRPGSASRRLFPDRCGWSPRRGLHAAVKRGLPGHARHDPRATLPSSSGSSTGLRLAEAAV